MIRRKSLNRCPLSLPEVEALEYYYLSKYPIKLCNDYIKHSKVYDWFIYTWEEEEGRVSHKKLYLTYCVVMWYMCVCVVCFIVCLCEYVYECGHVCRAITWKRENSFQESSLSLHSQFWRLKLNF